MTNQQTPPPTAKSEKEVRKQNPLSHFSGSKFSPAYWREKVFRPSYRRDGQTNEVSEWYCQIQHAGRREKIALATNDRQEAARKAAKLFANWLLTRDPSTLWATHGETNSRRNDVSPFSPTALPTPGKTYIQLDREELIPELAKTQEIAQRVLG